MAKIFAQVVIAATLLSAVSCSPNEKGGDASGNEHKGTEGPVLVKAGSGQDLFWLWLTYDQTGILKPIFKPLQDMTGQTTQQISDQILENVPFSQQVVDQVDQAGQQISEVLNPQRIPIIGPQLSGLTAGGSSSGGGGSNPLSSILGSFGRR